MNPDNNNPSEAYDSSIQDIEDHSYSGSTSPDSSISLSTPSTIAYDMQIEQQMSDLFTEETFSICTDDNDDDDHNCNEGPQQDQQTQQMTSTLSQDWLPSEAASTPLSTIAATHSPCRSEREIENELFQNIEKLVREFLRRPNCKYPYYQIIQWTMDEPMRLEYALTVIINRPTIIL